MKKLITIAIAIALFAFAHTGRAQTVNYAPSMDTVTYSIRVVFPFMSPFTYYNVAPAGQPCTLLAYVPATKTCKVSDPSGWSFFRLYSSHHYTWVTHDAAGNATFWVNRTEEFDAYKGYRVTAQTSSDSSAVVTGWTWNNIGVDPSNWGCSDEIGTTTGTAGNTIANEEHLRYSKFAVMPQNPNSIEWKEMVLNWSGLMWKYQRPFSNVANTPFNIWRIYLAKPPYPCVVDPPAPVAPNWLPVSLFIKLDYIQLS